jgi:hypothetical protein
MQAAGISPPRAPSGDAKVARRNAMLWLDNTFDIEKGCYKDGMTDAKVGAEVGLAEKAIADLRVEFGYDLKLPPELANWRKELDALEQSAARFRADSAATARSIDEGIKRLSDKIAAWEALR